MTTTTERRRNAYPDNCRVCGTRVEAGAGWLYADVKSQRSRHRRSSGRGWIKTVKCDRCHTANIAHGWQARNLDNPKPKTPRIGVSEVRKGHAEAGHWVDPRWQDSAWQMPVVRWVLPDGRSEIICQLRPITGEPMWVPASYYSDRLWFGCELTPGAEKELDGIAERVFEAFRTHLES